MIKRNYFKISLVLYSILLVLLVECYYKLYLGTKLNIIANHSIYGWTFVPNKNWQYYDNGKIYKSIKTNSDGFRDVEYVPENKKDILILGGSYLAGRQVDQKDLFSSVVERQLGDNFKVLNRGIPAWSTDQQLLFLQSNPELIKKADKIILIFTDNDIKENYYKGFFKYENDKLKKQVIYQYTLSEKFLLWLSHNCATFQFANNYFQWKIGSFEEFWSRFYTDGKIGVQFEDIHNYLIEEPEFVSFAKRKTVDLLQQIFSLTQDKLIIILKPTRMEFNENPPTHDTKKLYYWLKNISTEHKVPLFTLDEITDHKYFGSGNHYSVLGHQVVGNKIFEILNKSKDSDLKDDLLKN